MRNTILSLSVLLLFLVTGCKSLKDLAVPTGSLETIRIPAKKVALTPEQLDRWSYTDLATDSIPGMSLDKAYGLLAGMKSKPVVVAVADTGLDIDHEDLKDVVWVNPKEKAGNGIDDDKNGFIDDIHGWNFLGDIYDETLEITRMVRMGEAKYKDKNVDVLPTEERRAYIDFKKVKAAFEKEKEGSSSTHYYNLDFNPRAAYDKDAYNYDVKIYGNNKVKNTIDGESHSSHVAGIIAASRGNGKGIDGVADNVKIMALRMVPNGDEYDKDVALAIRYAVDNGAKVINCSFGKKYSPNPEWVYDAIKYAADKDVLIVIAAMNNAENIDVIQAFPGDAPDRLKEISNNLLTVGAIGYQYNEKMVASFSNYGKINVDVFAPGVRVNSSVPGSKYKKYNGTSMASPSAAGVAALLRSYFPKLSAKQVKKIIMNSGTRVDMEVIVPGTGGEKKLPFSELCVSSRIVNAYNAIMMAKAMTK